MSIGFVNNEKEKIIPQVSGIINFDSGYGISEEAGSYNTIVFGSTGTGKTSGLILPAVASLIEAGYGGLIVDIKGNFTDHVRNLAEKRNRSHDIIEFGSSKSATPINILANLSSNEAYDLFMVLATYLFKYQTGNMDWHLKGVRVLTDCFEFLQILHEKFDKIQNNFSYLTEIINNSELCSNLFNLFNEQVFDESNKSHNRFKARISENQFHPLSYNKDKKNLNKTNYAEQVTWQLQAVRSGLEQFRKTPSLMQNFSAFSENGLDMDKLIYQEKKIIVLRFDIATGGLGNFLARYFVEQFYRATYKSGLKQEKYSFLIGDEFQDFVNLDFNYSLNDNAFTAKAREYKVIQLMGTQSMSSLVSRTNNSNAVLEFINNFNNRIVLYCDDPTTGNMVKNYLPTVALNDLGSGEVVRISFDAASRKHLFDYDSIQQSHDKFKNELDNAAVKTEYELADAYDENAALTIEDIYNDIISTPKADNLEQKGQGRNLLLESILNNKDRDDFKWNIKKPNSNKIEQEDKQVKENITISKGLNKIVNRYPQFFQLFLSDSDYNVCVPKGWLPSLEKGLKALKASEVSFNILTFNISRQGSLEVYGKGSDIAKLILTNPLSSTGKICPICGDKLSNTKEEEPSNCQKCLNRFGLKKVMPQVRRSPIDDMDDIIF